MPGSQPSPPINVTRTGLEDRLILRSWEDEDFRLALLQDPRAVIERELEAIAGRAVPLPPQLLIHVHQETPDEMHLTLPFRGDQLADDNSLLLGFRRLLR